ILSAPESEHILYWGESLHPQNWYGAADVFLSCSSWEGMPLAPLEAMGHGLPLLLSNIPGHHFLEERSWQYELNAPQQGAQALSDILQMLQSQPTAMREILEKRAAWTREHYSLAKMTEQYEESYIM
ncbi:MAG: glycosyltransferase family 4 protein, partial [Deltaproteobacteria bacterium]|nr:glycosyltransferase family 4 protein [Deltaproteobacteria bacterium]